MKKVKIYQDENGFFHFYKRDEYKLIEVEYDETAPCKICGLPVEEASMGGTDICPACDCGVFRNGEKWNIYPDKYHLEYFKKLAKEKQNKVLLPFEQIIGDKNDYNR